MRSLVAAQETEYRPGNYTLHDLQRLKALSGLNDVRNFAVAHKKAGAAGIVKIIRLTGEGFQVNVLPIGDAVKITGFARLLKGAIEANARKLGRARPRETHLAVLVDRTDASVFASETPVPSLPREIDVLWVLHKWHRGLNLPGVWRARRRTTSWEQLDYPDR